MTTTFCIKTNIIYLRNILDLMLLVTEKIIWRRKKLVMVILQDLIHNLKS